MVQPTTPLVMATSKNAEFEYPSLYMVRGLEHVGGDDIAGARDRSRVPARRADFEKPNPLQRNQWRLQSA